MLYFPLYIHFIFFILVIGIAIFSYVKNDKVIKSIKRIYWFSSTAIFLNSFLFFFYEIFLWKLPKLLHTGYIGDWKVLGVSHLSWWGILWTIFTPLSLIIAIAGSVYFIKLFKNMKIYSVLGVLYLWIFFAALLIRFPSV
jgi:hypothetical protein